jgi:hypothetical protein
VCRKYQRHCGAYLDLQEAAYAEWEVAETLEAVRAAWGRLGGRVVLHRYGRQHFSLMARHRHGDTDATVLLHARMIRRRS